MDADRYYPPIRHRGWTIWQPRRTVMGVPVPPPTVTDLDDMVEALRTPANWASAVEVTAHIPPEGSGSIAPS